MKNRSMIICEGESDQIILSYYFEKQFGYRFDRKKGELPNILNENPKAEFVRLYRRSEDGDEIVIWAIGGHSLFDDAVNAILEINQSSFDICYSSIVVITDNDTRRETEQLWTKLNERLKIFGMGALFLTSQWGKGTQKVAMTDKLLPIKALGLSLPPDEDGALETFLLDALAEQGNNGYLAEKSKAFVGELVAHPEKIKPYLSKRGLRVKAPLAVFLAIASPGRVFEPLKPMLEAVSWEKYKTVQEGFRLLDEEFFYKDGV